MFRSQVFWKKKKKRKKEGGGDRDGRKWGRKPARGLRSRDAGLRQPAEKQTQLRGATFPELTSGRCCVSPTSGPMMLAPVFSLPPSSTCFAAVPDAAGILLLFIFFFLCGGMLIQEIKILIESHHTSASLLLAPGPIWEPELAGHIHLLWSIGQRGFLQQARPLCQASRNSIIQSPECKNTQARDVSCWMKSISWAVGEVSHVSLGSRTGCAWELEAFCYPFLAFWCVVGQLENFPSSSFLSLLVRGRADCSLSTCKTSARALRLYFGFNQLIGSILMQVSEQVG